MRPHETRKHHIRSQIRKRILLPPASRSFISPLAFILDSLLFLVFAAGDLLQRESSGVISEPRSRQLAALRADSQLEKGRSPPRPLRPLGSGGTDSALRLVTCWSSDVLRLSSLGQTGRKSSNQADIDAFVAGEDYYKGWFFWQWYEF